MEWLLWVLLFFLWAASMIFLLDRIYREKKSTRPPLKDLLIGYDFSKSSWKSSSMTKGTKENPLEDFGEPQDRNELKKRYRRRTYKRVEEN